MAAPRHLPQFPLGMTVLPSMVLPLQVFEPRYLAMLQAIGEADNTFGVVLIQRGAEVGGGEQRYEVGVAASIVESAEVAPGRWHVIAVGQHRYRVINWLDDAPYPNAIVEPWPDEDAGSLGSEPAILDAAFDAHRRCLERAGVSIPPFDPDPSTASFQMAATLPIGDLDRYRLLCAPGTTERLTSVIEVASQTVELLDLLDASGTDPS